MNPATPLHAPRPPRRIGLSITVFVLVTLTTYLAWRGFDFYRQSLSQRPMHPDYRKLSPSGLIGHGYGMVGTALILTNLLYLVRRRFAKYLPAWVGSMRAWLNAHVFTGLVGSVLILFHSAFQLRTPIATVTSVSLSIVVLTGIIGLYLYALVPKEGLKPLRDRLDEIRPLLPGLVVQVEDFVKKTPLTAPPAQRVLHADDLHHPALGPRGARAPPRSPRGGPEGQDGPRPRADAPEAGPRVHHRAGRARRQRGRPHAGAALMRSWRSLHRFLAILMIVSVSVHIGVAWFYGFRWIFE